MFTAALKMFLNSSVVTAATDAYFNLVSLLLPGNGTNGAQNNTFLDSSTNNFALTRNGNATQGTFSPFSQTGWSVYFNRGRLTTTLTGKSADTGSVTYELFFYSSIRDAAVSGNSNLFNSRGGGSGANGIDCTVTSSGAIGITTSGSGLFTSASNVVALSRWYHLAVVRNGTTNWTVYLDAISLGTFSYSTSLTSTDLYIGDAATQDWLKGYISNFRYTRAAVYTGSSTTVPNFTVPTAPLEVIANTEFLGCASNRFNDLSANNFTVTPSVGNGTLPAIQAFEPFAPNVAYTISTIGGSGYFDGTGDWLNNASLSPNLSLGTSNFCIEAWGYWLSFNEGSFGAPLMSFGGGSGTQFMIRASKTAASVSNANYYFINSNTFIPSAGFSSGVSGGTIYLNSWNHIAVTRQGSTFRLFVNGALVNTQTDSGSYNTAYTNVNIGADTDPNSGRMSGYIAGARVVTGNAVYTTAFTPPTAPFTAIPGTYLLANFTNAGIIDAAAKNIFETVGNASISTTQSKFGGGSIFFDGSGDYLTLGSNVSTRTASIRVNEMNNANATIEMWVYTANSSSSLKCLVDTRSGQNTDTGYGIYQIANHVVIYGAGVKGNAANQLTGNTWVHLAVTRANTTNYVFINGTLYNTFSYGNTLTSSNVTIASDVAGSNAFTGYIDDLRITNGFARYTANFTPTTTAFPLQ